MGHTPEQRDQHPLCGARKKNGESCRSFAGLGTPHFGVGRCKFHGGSTGSHRRHALDLEARRRMVALSVPVENAEPYLVLLQELAMSAGHVQFLRGEISELDPADLGDERSKTLLHRYDAERDRLSRIARTCSEAGVDQARIKIEEAKAVLITHAVTNAAKEAGIPPRYVQALGPALRKQVALMAGDDEGAQAAEGKVAELRSRIKAEEEQRIERAAARRRPPDLTYPPEEWIPEEPSAA